MLTAAMAEIKQGCPSQQTKLAPLCKSKTMLTHGHASCLKHTRFRCPTACTEPHHAGCSCGADVPLLVTPPLSIAGAAVDQLSGQQCLGALLHKLAQNLDERLLGPL